MPSTFPGAIDSFTDPLSNSPLNSPSHSTLHSDINDAVEKVEQYMGLVKVIPTSVSSAGGTAATLNSTTGTVTVGTNNTSVTVNGAFSSLYVNYRIVVNIAAQSLDGYGRIQFNNQTGSFYYDLASEMSWTTATVTAVASAVGTTGRIGRYTSALDYFNSTFDVLLPNQSTRTWVQGQSTAPGYFWTFGVQEASNTSHTGFTLSPSTGVWTGGTIRVYGYRN